MSSTKASSNQCADCQTVCEGNVQEWVVIHGYQVCLKCYERGVWFTGREDNWKLSRRSERIQIGG